MAERPQDDETVGGTEAGAAAARQRTPLSSDPSLAPLNERYDLLAELGRGGMGIVYRARDRDTDEIVALKVLQPAIAARSDLIDRFKGELRLARKITHKNVCRVYDLNRFGTLAAISMEYVEGESLRALLERVEGLSVPHGLKILRQIFRALAEAHAQGVVHRDLKPENILIARDGIVKLMDFGVARLTGTEATLTGGIIGTPAYMSPEQASGKPADERSDIYSLGLVIYEMFTGHCAFHADTPIALALKQIQETPPPPCEVNPYLPEFLDRAICKCLEKDPGRRFQSVAELEAAIEAGPAPQTAEEVVGSVPAIPDELESNALPSGEVRWQPSDSWLVGGGVLAAALFFAFYSIVYPYSSLRIHIGPEAAADKAVALVRQFEPSATSGEAQPYWRWWLGDRPATAAVLEPEIDQAIAFIYVAQTNTKWWLLDYPMKAAVLGLREANRQLAHGAYFKDGAYWEARVNLEQGRTAVVGLRTDGALAYLNLPPRPGNQTLPPSPEQATRDSAAYVRQLLGTDVSNLQPQTRHVGPAIEVVWDLSGPIPDLKRRIHVELGSGGRISVRDDVSSRHSVEIWDRVAPSLVAQMYTLRYRGPGWIFLYAVVFLMMTLFFSRKLYQRPPRSAIPIALCWTVAQGGMWLQGNSGTLDYAWLVIPAAALVIFLTTFFPLATANDYLWRRLRSHAVTWFLLVRRPGQARGAGLSIMRGCALGFMFLAAHTVIVYALGSAKRISPDLFWLEVAAWSGRPYLALFALSYAVQTTIFTAWCRVGFLAALASRAGASSSALIGVPAAVWLFAVFNLPGTTPAVCIWPPQSLWAQLLFAALQGIVFSLIFYRYDLLTLAVAVFTVETWLLIFPVWTIFSAIRPLDSLAMLPWFSLLLSGATIYLRPQLAGARRHIAAVFE